MVIMAFTFLSGLSAGDRIRIEISFSVYLYGACIGGPHLLKSCEWLW